MPARSFGVLFVCTGNICRSPTAEGVFRKLVVDAGLAADVVVDSAATIDMHVGRPPDPRTIDVARRRGYDLTPLRARQVERDDLARFDLVLAMARNHHRELQALARRDERARVRMFRAFTRPPSEVDVPDPYFGDTDDFEHVLDLVEDGCAGLLEVVRAQIGHRH